MSVPTPPPQQAPPIQFPAPPQRQSTQPSFSVGIAAGAEDVKYQAKYKDLKRKVKEIEADNDKLHFKVLQAKRSIQRMKLERAVLYERLQLVPPSPELQDRLPLPPVQPSPGMAHQQPQQHHGPSPNHPDYARPHGVRQDSRPGPMDSPMAPSPHHSARRGSASGPEPRQLQFMPHMPPVQADPHRTHAPIHASPRTQHPSASHERAHSPSRARGHPPPPVYHPHPQPYPDVPQAPPPLHSPPLSERGRGRRHDIHELTAAHTRHPASMPPLSPPGDARSGAGSAIHNHQRIGPGTYVNRDDFLDRERDIQRDRERDWDRDRDRGRPRDAPMRPPPAVHRARPGEYPDPHAPPPPPQSRRRDDAAYPAPPGRRGYSPASTGSPRSASRSPAGDPPARDERERAFRLRPVAQGEEVDFVHEDGRAPAQARDRNGGGGGGGGGGYAPEQSRPPAQDSRKRSRNDMDVDDPDEGASQAMYPRHSDAEPRGAKRYHPGL
ncbi:hypothetical protein B0H15DRAFT_829690 [Mycena belliarum]|uniref:INO80 complex subunit F domain-containing protein n=1 Tax=Mycena belliarum TaxID=1033014 RepID=A0AAD6XX20_9AGAR|nr:hypothetical protein B0H15DRAFT_829690 [Mycena belliae]